MKYEKHLHFSSMVHSRCFTSLINLQRQYFRVKTFFSQTMLHILSQFLYFFRIRFFCSDLCILLKYALSHFYCSVYVLCYRYECFMLLYILILLYLKFFSKAFNVSNFDFFLNAKCLMGRCKKYQVTIFIEWNI